MRNIESVKHTFLLLCIISATFVSCQDVIEQNNTKIVNLQDPQVDKTVKSALENGSASEVVVRKDLLLFPVNAPNLVIAHRQEIHAVPQLNDSDGKPAAAKVAEINEYSLSQLVSTNDTDNSNETENEGASIASSPFSGDRQNDSILEPGKLLEIPAGYNLTDGLVTEKVTLPEKVQNITVPKQSIVDILSKSLSQSNESTTSTIPLTYQMAKRSTDSEENESVDNESKSVKDTNKNSNNTKIEERSVDSEENKENGNETNSKELSSNGSNSTSNIEKRSDDSDERDGSNTTKYHDHEE